MLANSIDYDMHAPMLANMLDHWCFQYALKLMLKKKWENGKKEDTLLLWIFYIQMW